MKNELLVFFNYFFSRCFYGVEILVSKPLLFAFCIHICLWIPKSINNNVISRKVFYKSTQLYFMHTDRKNLYTTEQISVAYNIKNKTKKLHIMRIYVYLWLKSIYSYGNFFPQKTTTKKRNKLFQSR